MNRPVIQEISLSPNPVNAKQTITISIDAIDKEIVFSTAFMYLGSSTDPEIFANEEVGII